MGKRGGDRRTSNLPSVSQKSLSLGEEKAGKRQTNTVNGETSVPSMASPFGHGLASANESLGLQRCETILQPGFNSTIQIEKNQVKARRRCKKPKTSMQNTVVHKCHFCSNRSVKRGTPEGHMKDKYPKQSVEPEHLKSSLEKSADSMKDKKIKDEDDYDYDIKNEELNTDCKSQDIKNEELNTDCKSQDIKNEELNTDCKLHDIKNEELNTDSDDTDVEASPGELGHRMGLRFFPWTIGCNEHMKHASEINEIRGEISCIACGRNYVRRVLLRTRLKFIVYLISNYNHLLQFRAPVEWMEFQASRACRCGGQVAAHVPKNIGEINWLFLFAEYQLNRCTTSQLRHFIKVHKLKPGGKRDSLIFKVCIGLICELDPYCDLARSALAKSIK
ncbi:RNAse P, Rpr2/Rpp21 subunit [Melia azedarach]|uniref:RNAse P, Rpr2/Rpp21 subunit n=1 Tax=Melia azedarach TaxID=155640 RepID=A0ACC1XMP0_MELAZ|nr:RNAse P, Rpr2/Rpp21 subunit [Melia azedarach]